MYQQHTANIWDTAHYVSCFLFMQHDCSPDFTLTNSFWRSPTKAQIRGKSVITVCEYSKTRSERCADVSQTPERYLVSWFFAANQLINNLDHWFLADIHVWRKDLPSHSWSRVFSRIVLACVLLTKRSLEDSGSMIPPSEMLVLCDPLSQIARLMCKPLRDTPLLDNRVMWSAVWPPWQSGSV